MKLTKPNLKIKMNYNQLETLFKHLKDVADNESFFNSFDYLTSRMMKHYLISFIEKIFKKMFNSFGQNNKNLTLNLNEGEQVLLLIINTNLQVPAYLYFIHQTITENFEL